MNDRTGELVEVFARFRTRLEAYVAKYPEGSFPQVTERDDYETLGKALRALDERQRIFEDGSRIFRDVSLLQASISFQRTLISVAREEVQKLFTEKARQGTPEHADAIRAREEREWAAQNGTAAAPKESR